MHVGRLSVCTWSLYSPPQGWGLWALVFHTEGSACTQWGTLKCELLVLSLLIYCLLTAGQSICSYECKSSTYGELPNMIRPRNQWPYLCKTEMVNGFLVCIKSLSCHCLRIILISMLILMFDEMMTLNSMPIHPMYRANSSHTDIPPLCCIFAYKQMFLHLGNIRITNPVQKLCRNFAALIRILCVALSNNPARNLISRLCTRASQGRSVCISFWQIFGTRSLASKDPFAYVAPQPDKSELKLYWCDWYLINYPLTSHNYI